MTIANQSERDAWNGESGERWVADADGRDRVMTNVADALLAAAGLRAGESVLDVGCGCGATTLAAARAVGADGSVLGVDLSEPMLGVARHRVADAALANVTLVATDAQTHAFEPGGRDVAISRFRTMFFDDPAAAFTNIAGALRPGGRLCIVTWQPLLANDWLTVPGAALLQYGSPPEAAASGPGMFAQSEPDVVARILRSAGFTEIGVEPRTVPLHLGADLDGATAHLANTGPGRAMLATIPEDQRAGALEAVRTALTDHLDGDGVHLDGGILLTTARR